MNIKGLFLLGFSFLLFLKKVDAQKVIPDTVQGTVVYPISLNSKHNEYSPVLFEDKLLFCSNSKTNILPYYSTETGAFLDNLVEAKIEGKNQYSKCSDVLKDTWVKSVKGPSTVSLKGDVLYFTGSCVLNEEGCDNNKGYRVLKIYQAEKVNEEWASIKEFPYNHKDYSVGHPAISPDGLFLVFASNNPDGYGKSDLYITYLKNSKWTKPQNLGPNINTSGNEMFPFISRDNILYFSSDSLPGKGGFDIYSSHEINSVWQKPVNLGKPVNSPFDDFGFCEEQPGFSGYFSSNRKAGTDDDIYRFEKLKPDCDSVTPFPFCFTFYEVGTFNDETLPLQYEWDFGDGSKERGLEVSHCFKKPGNYKINLNIIDTITGNIYFNEASYEMEVKELNKAHIEVNGTTTENTPINLSAEKSYLKDCIFNNYFWSFGDGKTGEGINISHTYSVKGEYEINLTAKGKSIKTGLTCMSCVYKKIKIGQGIEEKYNGDTAEVISDLAQTLHTVKNKNDLVYKVRVATSETPIKIDSVNFKNLENVEEYKDIDVYGYVVGKENSLSSAYPLYVDIREKGYNDARVVAFKNGKIISGKDTSMFSKKSKNVAFTQISGRIIDRYGEPLRAEIILENLNTGKIISKILSDSTTGRFSIILPNEEMYGFYAELPGYYSVSNYIDLRGEKRHLEIKKNIEMVHVGDLNKEGIAIRLNNIFFDINEYQLKKESFSELNRLVELIIENPGAKVEISGHTDNTGSPEANLVLSRKRADSVKDYLIFMGIDEGKIISKGYGDTQPLVSNNTERGRYLNRRVEFRLFFN